MEVCLKKIIMNNAQNSLKVTGSGTIYHVSDEVVTF